MSRVTSLPTALSLLANITQSSKQGSSWTVWKKLVIYLLDSINPRLKQTKILVGGNFFKASSVARYGLIYGLFGTGMHSSSQSRCELSISRTFSCPRSPSILLKWPLIEDTKPYNLLGMELLSTVDEDEQLSGSDTCEIFVPSVSVSDSKKDKKCR